MKVTEILHKIIHYFNLESELDNYENIHEEIVKGVVFKGTNLWILVFAIIVASVGLNMNSTAVIIGAMLISPLMGPINGMGYSIATYNYDLFRLAFKNFSFAVVASLLASTAYFAISPVATAHSELLARTSPTIYDVLIALFGGLAGIVAISSRQKGNVIPGVAIATALMPPLCTAGYGLATFQFDFFLGALYLFTINSVFMALASVAISQILKFPIRSSIEANQKRNINHWITAVIVIVLLPSIYFGYGLVQKERFNEYAKKYISSISMYESNYLLESNVDSKEKSIILVYAGINLTEDQKNAIIQRAHSFKLDTAKILIKQGLSFRSEDTRNVEEYKLREELNLLNNSLKVKDLQIDSLRRKDQMGKILLNEIRNLYPQIIGCTYAESFNYQDTAQVHRDNSIVFFELSGKSLTDSEKVKIKKWLGTRLNQDEIRVIYE